jgi:hypothetical protein
VGAAGGVMMFVLLMAATVIVGAYVFAYLAHIFLSLIESTATGFEEVAWPDEPYVDWLWKGVYLLWLVAIWLVPLLFAGPALTRAHPGAEPALWLAAGLFWFCFPISLLSSMGSSSRWFLFSISLVPRLMVRFGSLVTFYVLTAPLLAGVALIVWWNNRSADLLPVPVAAFAVAVGLMIYGRLFGRLALMVTHTDKPEVVPAPRPRDRVPVQVRAAAYDPIRTGRRIRQPSELPPTDALDPEARTGYDLRVDNAPEESGKPAGHGWRVIDPPEPYVIADGPAHIDPPRPALPERISKPSEFEMQLARTDKSPTTPEQPFTRGTFDFPFWSANRGPLVGLTFGLCVFGVCLKFMIMLLPS